MSDTKTDTITRGGMLKQLRATHAESVQQAQAIFREQKQMQQSICQLIRTKSMIVPEIAEHIGKPTSEVLWFIAALKKYGIVAEAGMCGDYPLYKLAQETEE